MNSKKRTQTSYGEVEYDTIQCHECSLPTVVEDVTHIYETMEAPDSAGIKSTEVTVHPVCSDCIEATYEYTGELLPHDSLRETYDEYGSTQSGVDLVADVPEITTTTEPTQHGDVDLDIAACSHCDGEWTVSEMKCVHIPSVVVENEVHAGTRLYCPDCRELYIDALSTDALSFYDIVEGSGSFDTGHQEVGDADSDLGEEVENIEGQMSAAKVIVGYFLLAALISSIGAGIGLGPYTIFLFMAIFGTGVGQAIMAA